MIESVYLVESDRDRHRRAPLLPERERYLNHMIEAGCCRERVRNVATMLLHVVRLLELDRLRAVAMDEVLEGCKRWVDDANARRYRRPGMACPYTFKLVATNWLRFQGALVVGSKPPPPFGDLLTRFLEAMRSERGLAFDTLHSYRGQILRFMKWLQSRCPEFSAVRARHIDDYIEKKRLDGSSRSSVASLCRALRTFFGYAERQGWCIDGIRGSIISPRVPRVGENLNGPPWEAVRRVIAAIGDSKPCDLRAKAMFLLFSIYGFRSAEVRGLMLEDIEWRRGTITVHRAKRGRIQQFPLQCEVGEAIAQYLEKARPKCACRSLFVTLHPPYRPVLGHSMSTIICPRIRKLGIETGQFGPHMLRRACATQLLRTGSSLKEIADLLGHRDLRSVANYAKFNSDSLKCVADFDLKEFL